MKMRSMSSLLVSLCFIALLSLLGCNGEGVHRPDLIKDAPIPSQSGTICGRNAAIVRLATWNLHDLFDEVDDPYNDKVIPTEKLNAKLTAITECLVDMDADIVGVQEVENKEVLGRLAKLAGFKYYELVEGNDIKRGIDVGVLSRIPIKNVVSHTEDMLGKAPLFSRDCLEVHFDHPTNLVLLVNHFKSMNGNQQAQMRSNKKRVKQAKRVLEIAQSLEDFPVAIVGDLNSNPDSETLYPLLRNPGINDSMVSIPKAKRITFSKGELHSALDYILLNNKLEACRVSNTCRIINDEKAAAASDHFPVCVDLDLSLLMIDK